MVLTCAWRTATGARLRNEDRVVCLPERGLFAVIDGLGGEAAGDIAAEEVAKEIASEQERSLVETFGAARDRLGQRVRDDARTWGMGAVATAVRIRGGAIELAHVGDTRAGLLRGGAPLRWLTIDHVLPVANGAVTRDLGSAKGPAAHWAQAAAEELQTGDRVILATDGVHGVVAPSMIEAVLRTATSDEAFVTEVMCLVERAGAPDNASVLVISIAGGP